MALTVEDGSVVAGADSYNSLVEITTYNTEYVGQSAWTDLSGDAAAQERHARIGARALDQNWAWKGSIVSSAQELLWPRVGVYAFGYLVDYTTLPGRIKEAHAWLSIESARLEAAGDTLIPAETMGGGLTLDRIRTGDVEIEQQWDQGASRNGLTYPFVEGLVSGYTTSRGILKRVGG